MNPKILGSPKLLGAPEKIASGLPEVPDKATQNFRSIVKSVAWQETAGVPGYINYGKTFRLNISYESSIRDTTHKYWIFFEVDGETANVSGNPIAAKLYELGKSITYLDIDQNDIGHVKQGSVLIADFRQDLGDHLIGNRCLTASIQVDILEKIPTVMNAKGWEKGKRCMEQWFKFNENTPKADLLVSNILTMAWAKSQWRDYYNYQYDVRTRSTLSLFGQKVENPHISYNNLLDSLKKGAKSTDSGKPLSDLFVENIKNCLIPKNLFTLPVAINAVSYCKFEAAETYKKIASSTGGQQFLCDLFSIDGKTIKLDMTEAPLQDFYAGVGNYQFKVIAFANIFKISDKQFDAHIYMYGLFLFDTYDFKDDDLNTVVSQSLGYWDVFQNNASKIPVGTNAYINNASFREWRTRHKRGQDYYNYSDIEYIKLDKEQVFSFDENFVVKKFIA